MQVSLSQDSPQIQGGRKKRRKFGADLFVVTEDGVVADTIQEQLKGGVMLDDKTINLINADKIAAEEEEARKSERKPSMVKLPGRDEYLLLPDRESVLKFDTLQDFSTDPAEAKILRDAAHWGRLFVKDFPVTFQFFRAHYGSAPPDGMVDILLAEPENMCEDFNAFLANKDRIGENTVIAAIRGNCTFGEKSIVAEALGAKGILFLNNEEGNAHPSAPDVREIKNFSPTMISKAESDYLLPKLRKDKVVKAAFIPIGCVAESKVVNSNELCHPFTELDKELQKGVKYGGFLKESDENIKTSGDRVTGVEFLSGLYGYPIEPGATYQLRRTPEVAKDTGVWSDACEPYSAADAEQVKGKAILVDRGTCNFYNKTKNLMDAGATAVIIANDGDVLSRPGVQPKWLGFELFIPFMLISKSDGEALSKSLEAERGEIGIKMQLDDLVQVNHWTQLDAFAQNLDADNLGWPAKKRDRVKLFKKLKEEWGDGKASPSAYSMLMKLAAKKGVDAEAAASKVEL
jgi:hypothetical protein